MNTRKSLLLIASIGAFGLAMQASIADQTRAVAQKMTDTATDMAKDKAKGMAKDKAEQAIEEKADADHKQ